MDFQFLAQNWHLFLVLAFILALLLLEPMLLKASGISMISPLRVSQLVNRESATIIDVCTDKEYTRAHIPDSLNIPLGELSGAADKVKKFKDKPVIISCRSGNRAKSAAKKLSKLGLKQLYILSGGNLAWEKENLPMRRTS